MGTTSKKIEDAKKAGDWDQVILLEKAHVRAACNIKYRWDELVSTLLSRLRSEEATMVLQEMDARGFEINPALVEYSFPNVAKFLKSAEFARSPIGVKVNRLMKISDDRRTAYRQLLARMSSDQKPPNHYVVKGACPFECCVYRTWNVLVDTTLVDFPGTNRIVGTALHGTKVSALTGEVHLKPEPVVVLASRDLPKNSIVFILDHEGEGGGHVYSHGKVMGADLSYSEYCFRPSESCWGERLWSAKERREQVWWVKIRVASGAVGWTDNARNFSGNDMCG